MALAQVLWGASLLAIISAMLVATGNSSYSTARNTAQQVQHEVALEAGIMRGILGVLDTRIEQRWRVDGVEQEFHFNDHTIRIAIQDELGRYDLNHIEQQTLARLLQTANLDALAAGKLAEKILDWREPTSTKRLNGAKARDYESAGLLQQPRNGPFQSLDELLLVMGMTNKIFETIRPALTVNSSHQFIDPAVATPEAMLAHIATNATQAAALVAERRSNNIGKFAIDTNLAGRTFTVTATPKTEAGNRMEKTIKIAQGSFDPYWVLNLSKQATSASAARNIGYMARGSESAQTGK